MCSQFQPILILCDVESWLGHLGRIGDSGGLDNMEQGQEHWPSRTSQEDWRLRRIGESGGWVNMEQGGEY